MSSRLAPAVALMAMAALFSGCVAAPQSLADVEAQAAGHLATARDLAVEVRFEFPHDPSFETLHSVYLWAVLVNAAGAPLQTWGNYSDDPGAYMLTIQPEGSEGVAREARVPGAEPRNANALLPFPVWQEWATRFDLSEMAWSGPVDAWTAGNYTVTATLDPYGLSSAPATFRILGPPGLSAGQAGAGPEEAATDGDGEQSEQDPDEGPKP